MYENNFCKICNSKSDKIIITLTCCGYLECKEHLDKTIQNGNNIGKCEICSEEIDIPRCLNILRNKNLITKFRIKSKRKNLEKELETFETLKKDPVYYMNESLKETIQKIYLRREELKMEVNKQIDEVYFEIMEEIKMKTQKMLDQFKMESELLEKSEFIEAKKILKEEINNDTTKILEILEKQMKKIIKMNGKIDLK